MFNLVQTKHARLFVRTALFTGTALSTICLVSPGFAAGGSSSGGGAGGVHEQPGIASDTAGGTAGAAGPVVTSDTGLSFTGGNGGNGVDSGNGFTGGGGGGGDAVHFSGSSNITSSGSLQGGSGGRGGNTGNLAGGGGGEGGFGATFSGSGNLTISGSATGGIGGVGGATSNQDSGNGGDGGVGVAVLNAGTLINSGTIIAGNGGAGGDGNFQNGFNGSGGRGGSGVAFANGGTLNNLDIGTISGGSGGPAGTDNRGGGNGQNGAGGVGVTGVNLTVVNAGTIAGGGGADAITFTGGTNMLTLSSGGTTGTLTGGIGITGALTIDPGTAAGTNVTLGNIIHDVTTAGSITKVGAGRLTLSDNNTYSGGTSLNAGILALGNSQALGTGTLTTTGGTTVFSAATELTVANNVVLGAGTTNFDSNGHPIFNFTGNFTGAGGLTKLGTNGLTLSGNNSYSGATIIARGTLTAGSTGGLSANSAFVVGTTATSATLDLNGNSSTVGSLAGSVGGVVTTSVAGNVRLTAGGNNTSTNFAGIIQDGAGTLALTKTGTGTLTLSGTNTYAGGTTFAGGVINAGSAQALGTVGTLSFTGGTLQYSAANQTDYSNRFSTAANQAYSIDTNGQAVTYATALTSAGGSLTKLGAGSLTLTAANTFTGLTTVSAGMLVVASTGGIAGGVVNNASFTTSGAVSGGLTNTGAVNANGGAINGPIANTAGTFTVGGTVTSNSTFANGATLAIGAAGNYTLQGLLTNNGVITVASGGQLTDTAGGITNTASGSITVAVGGTVRDDLNSAGIVTNNGAYIANVASNTGSITNTASGTWTGDVITNTGSIVNNGTWAGNVTTSAGGVFAGTGSVSNLTIDGGGAFVPGNGMPGSSATITGNLAFQSGAFYLIALNPQTASFANVGGAAALGGATVQAFFANGTYVAKQYTILSAAGGVSGSFNTLANTNLPSGFKSSLSYDATHAYLDLALSFVPPPGSGLNQNQRNVAASVVNFFNSNGSIPIVFGALTPAGLTQISGEVATGAQQTTFDAMNLFLGLITDPFVAGRSDAPAAGSAGALAYAPRGGYIKAPPLAPTFEQRWSTWVAGYGGSQTTDGNATLGSNRATSSLAAGAVGADYHLSPDTLLGFALAGGGTSFSVANGGTGRSDLFQAGAFIRHNAGPAYITAALAYGWQDITTDRTVSVANSDRLRANFNANAYSGRIEGGYRLVAPWLGGIGLTPYAAGQFTTFDLPNYAESVLGGANTFALNYASKSVTDTRSELGVRTDKSFAMQNGIFTLRGRAAWAHDFNPDRSLNATFQTLPGASFIVNGAQQARDSALVTAAADIKWLNGWSTAATFEGEFSDTTRSYAGKGVVRYAW